MAASMKFLISLLERAAPSPNLDKYLFRLFLTNFMSILALLVVVLQTLSLLNKSDEILAAPGATDFSLLQFVALQAPQYVNQMAPFAALMAVLATLANLANRNEITVMRSEGISAYQIVFPLEVAALVIAIGHFAIQELVVVDATRHLAAWQDSGYTSFAAPVPDSRRHVWLQYENLIIKAQRASTIESHAVLDKVTVFTYGADNLISSITYADFAWYERNDWALFGVRRLNVRTHDFSSFPSELLNADIPPRRFMIAAIRPDETSLPALRRAIKERRSAGQDSWSLETSYLHRFIAPAAALLMPLIGAMAGFGLPRVGGVWKRVAIGGLLGFSYFVADSLTFAMGMAGNLPPVLAVFAPFTVFGLIGLGVLFRQT
jgi:lipopolysaccharide export system permease protein